MRTAEEEEKKRRREPEERRKKARRKQKRKGRRWEQRTFQRGGEMEAARWYIPNARPYTCWLPPMAAHITGITKKELVYSNAMKNAVMWRRVDDTH
jgi:hypothetical protein